MPKGNPRHNSVPTNKVTDVNPDCRTRLRFPLDMDLQFQISRNGKSISGRGQVVNISSKALAFRTEGPICPDNAATRICGVARQAG
jgi:hypothetical protein